MTRGYACWDKRIEKAKERGEFTASDRGASTSWESCSIGEMAKKLEVDPRELNRVIDRILTDRRVVVGSDTDTPGLAFLEAVCEGRIEEAELIHNLIKAHAEQAVTILGEEKEERSR